MKSNNQIAQVQSIQHLWGKGIRDAAEIQRRTGIPRSTIYYNQRRLEVQTIHVVKTKNRVTQLVLRETH